MSALRFTKHFYGKLHLGMPLGINLRTVVENIDVYITRISTMFVTFPFQEKQLHYHLHSYNRSYDNERIIEIPIFRTFLKHVFPEQTLEVGNVFSHYQRVAHTIVDKYEDAPHVINQDIVSYQPKKRFNLIISISTIEHVGQDESTHNPDKAIKAINHLQTLLKSSGKCIISVPIGHNQVLDRFIAQYSIKHPKQVIFYERISENNRWQVTSPSGAMKHQYGKPFPCANALAIATFLPSPKA